MGRRSFIFDERLRGQARRLSALPQCAMNPLLDWLPLLPLCVDAFARLQTILRRVGVQVKVIPTLHEIPFAGFADVSDYRFELVLLKASRQRPPPVAVPQQNDEIGFDSGLLATRDLSQADLHGLLVEPRLLAHA